MAWLLTILICACTAIAPTASVHTAPTTQQPAITFPEIALPALPTLPDGVASLRNALQRLDVDSVLKTANEGGLVGLFRSAAGKRHEPVAEVAWDTAGSKIDTRCSAYGFSEKLRIRTGPCTKQIEVDNLELTSRVLGTLALDGWNSLSSKDGIDVYKRSGKDIEVGHYPPGVGAKKGDSSRFLCLWARGEIDAPIEKVYNLFLSNDYVLQVSRTSGEFSCVAISMCARMVSKLTCVHPSSTIRCARSAVMSAG